MRNGLYFELMMLYYTFLLLSVIYIVTKAQQQYRIISNTSTANNNQFNLKEIYDELNIFTSQLPYLNIMLRTKYLERDFENSYVKWFLQHSQVPLIISSYDHTYNISNTNEPAITELFRKNRDSFVITTESQDLENIANRFVQRAGVFFFIITDTQRPTYYEKLLNTMNLLWIKYKTYKNYVLTFEGIFYFDPFFYNTALNTYGGLVKSKSAIPLERIVFRNMHGYPLRIQIFKSAYARPRTKNSNLSISDIDGVDGRVAELLEQKMNFTMILQKPDPNYFGERTASGKYNGVIGSIIEDSVDFCFTGFFVKDYLVSEYMDFTVAVYDDQLCLYVPKAKRIPQSILPIFSVNYDIWFSFISSGFVCCFIWWVIRLLNIWLNIKKITDRPLDHSKWRQICRIFIDTWVVWVRVTILRYPPFNSELAFLGSLCLASVIFGAVFDSSLATVYIHPLYYNDIRTLKELDESNLQIIYKYSSMADDLFVSEASPLYASLNNKLVHVKDLDADILNEVAKKGGKASVTRANTLLVESGNYILSKQVNVIRECPKYYTISYVNPKDSPWQEAVNDWLLRFLSSGLIVKWINDMKSDVEIEVKISGVQFMPSETFKVLTVGDLQLAFYVVLMGNTLATISLISEYFIKNYTCNGKKLNNKVGI